MTMTAEYRSVDEAIRDRVDAGNGLASRPAREWREWLASPRNRGLCPAARWVRPEYLPSRRPGEIRKITLIINETTGRVTLRADLTYDRVYRAYFTSQETARLWCPNHCLRINEVDWKS